MHARCQSPSKSSWRPLHKPKCIEVDKLVTEFCVTSLVVVWFLILHSYVQAKDNVRSAHHLFVELNPCQGLLSLWHLIGFSS